MGNDVQSSKLSIEPQISHVDEKFDHTSSNSRDFSLEKSEKDIKIANQKKQILQDEKDQLNQTKNQIRQPIGLNDVKRQDEQNTNKKTVDEQEKVQYVRMDQKYRSIITRSNPIHVRYYQKYYSNIEPIPQINIREVQRKEPNNIHSIPESISSIGNSQKSNQLTQTELSGEKFAEKLLKRGEEIINSQQQSQLLFKSKPLSTKKQLKQKNIEKLLVKKSVQLESQNIQEDKLQQKCLGLFKINLSELPSFFQQLMSFRNENQKIVS